MKIEATGNTKEQAENALDLERLAVMREANAKFGEVERYGNCELGYKIVQEYVTKDGNQDV